MTTLVDDEVLDMDELTATDRCDRCGAQAYVRVVLPGPGSDLLFCAHHTHEHLDALRAKGAVVVRDDRDKLAAPTA